MRSFLPYLQCIRQRHFDDALAKAAQLVADGGYGHTSSLYIHPAPDRKKYRSTMRQ